MGVQYKREVPWDVSLIDLELNADGTIDGLCTQVTKKTAGIPNASLHANRFIPGAIAQVADGDVYRNSGTTPSPVWTLIQAGPGSGITSINGNTTQAQVIAAGTGISVASVAGTTTVSNTGVTSFNTLVGAVTISAGANITLTPVGNDIQIAATGGGQAGIQFEDEGVNLGTSGTATEVDFVGPGVTATRALNKVTVTVPGGSGGLSEFGYFFQTVADVAGTIAADNGKALFQTADSNNTAGFAMVPASGDITVTNAGIYEIDWSLSAAEPGAMGVFIGAALQIGTVYGSGAGTQQNTGKTILTLAGGDVISLRTVLCPAALTLQLAGTTSTAQVVASIMLKKIG